MPKKPKGGTLRDFSTSILSQSIKKMQGDPLGNFFFEKSRSAEKKMKGGPFGLAWYGMFSGKTGSVLIFCNICNNIL